MRAYLLLLVVVVAISCGQPAGKEMIELKGEAQGTTYTIKYYGDSAEEWKAEVDSILESIDLSLSTYRGSSTIISFNNDSSGIKLKEGEDHYFEEMFLKAEEIYQQTDGAFDPTVMPLVKYWGFSFEEIEIPEKTDSSVVDSLLKLVGFDGIDRLLMMTIEKESVTRFVKHNPLIMLDYNAIAQGYSVDILAQFLETKRVKNYLVELGGEMRVKGRTVEGKPWKVGIDKPVSETEDRQLQAVLELNDASLATSGNYRKFYIKDGVKYSHTIDPKTGYPVSHSLLSTTVIAGDCATADAYATAFMVMGVEKTKQHLSDGKGPSIEVYLIYSTGGKDFGTWMTEGMKEVIREDN